MNFNSRICTTKEQSERLLALGLKKETADCCWNTITLHGTPITYPSQESWMDYSIISDNHFPAWSLHRLIEMMPKRVDIPKPEWDLCGATLWFEVGDDLEVKYTEHLNEEYAFFEKTFRGKNLYDNTIDCIEWLTKEGYFNKEYLAKESLQRVNYERC